MSGYNWKIRLSLKETALQNLVEAKGAKNTKETKSFSAITSL
jgi:hypothetical protein